MQRTAWRCVADATLRKGLDRLSAKAGRLVAGETVMVLESVNYEGAQRLRCARGWVTAVTRQGRVKCEAAGAARLRQQVVGERRLMPGVILQYTTKVVDKADAEELFDEEERAANLLQLHGCPPAVAATIIQDTLRASVRPQAFCALSDLTAVRFHRLIADERRQGDGGGLVARVQAMGAKDVEQLVRNGCEQRNGAEAEAVALSRAAELMLGGDYAAAQLSYLEILRYNSGCMEADRGLREARKGAALLAAAALGVRAPSDKEHLRE